MPHNHSHTHDVDEFAFTVPDDYTPQRFNDLVQAFALWLFITQDGLRAGDTYRLVSTDRRPTQLKYRLYSKRLPGDRPDLPRTLNVIVWDSGDCSVEYRTRTGRFAAKAIARAHAARLIRAAKLKKG